jgi:AcrR family transcriptional regulator
MLIPARILRAYADDLPGAGPKFSARELDLQDRILKTAQHLFSRFGPATITFANLAAAMRLSPSTLKRHFLDADCILFEILAHHLRAIANAIGEVPHDAPELHKARREAYLAATRTAFNATTEPHTLLLRARQTLPPDLLETIETLRAGLGDMVAGPAGAVALTLLDTPELQAPQIEAMLAALQPPAEKIAPPSPSPSPSHPPSPRPMPPAPAPRKTRARPAAPQNQRSTRHARAGPADRFGGVAKASP